MLTTNGNESLSLYFFTSHTRYVSSLPVVNGRVANMPQYHTPTGTVSYPDAKSSFPKFPQVGFGRAVAIGVGAGFVGALVLVNGALVITLRLTNYY